MGPYFRPSNNATRGQVSKFVSISFFPECAANGPSQPSTPAQPETPTKKAPASETKAPGSK